MEPRPQAVDARTEHALDTTVAVDEAALGIADHDRCVACQLPAKRPRPSGLETLRHGAKPVRHEASVLHFHSDFAGELSGIRTRNPWIPSPML